MAEKCKDCCSRLFCMSVAEVNEVDFETMANKKDCRKRVFTNADRIRAMSDEELASLLNAAGCPCPEKNCRPSCKACISEWLKQPAKGE